MTMFSFPKSERICNKRDIDLLFAKAGSMRKENVLIRYTFRESKENEAPQQILIVVPKKRVRLATDRNRIKRQLREIYRLKKHENPVKLTSGKTLLMALIYVGGNKTEYVELEQNFLIATAKMKNEVA